MKNIDYRIELNRELELLIFLEKNEKLAKKSYVIVLLVHHGVKTENGHVVVVPIIIPTGYNIHVAIALLSKSRYITSCLTTFELSKLFLQT